MQEKNKSFKLVNLFLPNTKAKRQFISTHLNTITQKKMINKNTIEFLISKGDTEYLCAVLEKFPENRRHLKTHTRVLGIIQNELQQHQVNWMKNINGGANL
tara:strand:- start:92 stop:394 length:303 start_codon:yes stop_codon:yes gene_type:complete